MQNGRLLFALSLFLGVFSAAAITANNQAFANSSTAHDHDTKDDHKAKHGSHGEQESKAVSVVDAHVVLPPAAVPVMAGFATLHNPTDAPVVIVNVVSDAFERVEMHLTTIENDVAKMRKQAELTVPAGDSLELRHGSYHLMLMKPLGDLALGDTIVLALELASGETIPVEFAVTESMAKSKKHHNH